MNKIKFDEKFIILMATIAISAGEKIISEFKNKDFVTKRDGSPVTKADMIANEFIVHSLQEFNHEIPILSEESPLDVNILNSEFLWAVDPLDGTKEFISNSPDFTVNISLIKNYYPIFGIIYAPMFDILWLGIHLREDEKLSKSLKLYKASRAICDIKQNWKKISVYHVDDTRVI